MDINEINGENHKGRNARQVCRMAKKMKVIEETYKYIQNMKKNITR